MGLIKKCEKKKKTKKQNPTKQKKKKKKECCNILSQRVSSTICSRGGVGHCTPERGKPGLGEEDMKRKDVVKQGNVRWREALLTVLLDEDQKFAKWKKMLRGKKRVKRKRHLHRHGGGGGRRKGGVIEKEAVMISVLHRSAPYLALKSERRVGTHKWGQIRGEGRGQNGKRISKKPSKTVLNWGV